MGGKCMMCGNTFNRWQYDLHHFDGRNIPQGSLLHLSDNELIKEIKKCVLLCKNCHAEVTYQEKNGISF